MRQIASQCSGGPFFGGGSLLAKQCLGAFDQASISDEERYALMAALGLNMQDGAEANGGTAARVENQEGQRPQQP